MTRVLQYGMGPNRGGIETYLWNLARTLDTDKYHVDFLHTAAGQPPAFATQLLLAGSVFYGVTPRRADVRRNRRDLASLFARERFDILHFHANTASYVEPVRAALRSGVHVIYHSHNAGASRSPVTRALHRINGMTLPWHRITKVAVSAEAGGWMFGRSPGVEVIPNGIDVAAFAFEAERRELVRRALGIPRTAFLVGHIGAFLPAKNHQFLLDVFAEVVRRRPESLLALVGSGPLETKMRARVTELGLKGRVSFLGRRDDIADLLAGMDCLLFPSRYEGFGLVALEAQASGLPCVTSEAVPRSVAVRPSCTRLPLGGPAAAWADAVIESSRPDHGARKAGGDAVRAAGYSVDANTARIEAVYERLMGRAPV